MCREALIHRHKQLRIVVRGRGGRGRGACSQLALLHINSTEFDFSAAAAGSGRACSGNLTHLPLTENEFDKLKESRMCSSNKHLCQREEFTRISVVNSVRLVADPLATALAQRGYVNRLLVKCADTGHRL